MTPGQKPKPAATVILLRRREGDAFEIFLTRRPEGMAFLGGMYCFPGGTVRKDDCSPESIERCYGVNALAARKMLGSHFAPAQALGFWIAGVRELFEETGILLARDASTHCEVSEARRDRMLTLAAAEGRKSDENAISFGAALATENLLCDLSQLRYLSHWQTPSEQPIRFDTRFFLAALPEHQSPLASSPEVTHSIWLTPDEALRRFATNDLPMIFPTFASIRRLADFDSVDTLLAEYRAPLIDSP